MSCGKVKQNTLTDTFRKKRRRKTAKKEEKKTDAKPRGMRAGSYYRGAKEESEAKGPPHQPGGAVSQGFAGENYARRASFSTVKRRSCLTLTGRRRQATFAGIFVYINQ